MAMTGFFKDPTSRTGWSFVNEKGAYADAKPPASGAKIIDSPFAAGTRRRSKDQKPTAKPRQGYVWKFHNGSWVQVKATPQKQLTPGAGGLFPVPAPKPAPKPAPAPPKPAPAPPKPAPAPPKPAAALPGIDPRDSIYETNMLRHIWDRSTGQAPLIAEQAVMPSLYNQSYAGLVRDTLARKHSANASLAARGAIRSGGYQRDLDRRDLLRASGQATIESKYGSGRLSEITAELARLQAQYGLAHTAELNAAKERYQKNNPASTYVWQSISG